MGKTLIVSWRRDKLWHLVVSKPSTYQTSSQKLSPEDSESLIPSLAEATHLPSLGPGGGVDVSPRFPCYNSHSIVLKHCFCEMPTTSVSVH